MSTVSDKAAGAAGGETVTIEIDGVEMQAPKGGMVIEAADRAGIGIPRFCYHEKLSIAANCRMCLVDVEKAPKPLPACATPVAEGMKVFTRSRRAVDAQRAVMEFLLINHPLDCPICDQGGECELQDLAMGYGRSVSRFSERKRVVPDEDLGSLVSTDMTRCIQCTRCVRFLEEISGTCELGGIGRGEHMEIKTWVGRSIESELGGNIIDLCPVGALTNKPFRFRARPWELSARAGVAIHDALGSGYYAHTMRDRVYRVVPRANESINESWLADRDRWSCEGLYHAERLHTPRIRHDGEWRDASWQEAMETLATGLKSAASDALGALAGGNVSTEEYYLLQKVIRALGGKHLDHRLDELDFSAQAEAPGMPGFGLSLGQLESADHLYLVGCNPRHEAPILGHRVRKAWRGGARVDALNPLAFNFNFELASETVVGPRNLADELAAVARALGVKAEGALGKAISEAQVNPGHESVAEALNGADHPVLILGHLARRHPRAGWLFAMARTVAGACGGRLASLPSQANAAGAWAAGMLPHRGPGGVDTGTGRNARDLLENGADAFVLYQTEPDLDSALGAQARRSLEKATFVAAFSAFESTLLNETADLLLPVNVGIELDGTWINAFGDVAQQAAGVRGPGESRPGWRALRVLGNLLGLEGFDYQNIGQVWSEIEPHVEAARAVTGNPDHVPTLARSESDAGSDGTGITRIAPLPIYACDALVRRSGPLQASPLGTDAYCALNPRTADELGLSESRRVRVSHDGLSAEMPLRIEPGVPAGSALVPFGVSGSEGLGMLAADLEISAAGGGGQADA